MTRAEPQAGPHVYSARRLPDAHAIVTLPGDVAALVIPASNQTPIGNIQRQRVAVVELRCTLPNRRRAEL
jgi:hypothetical protein